jgi:tetratricopeptide (TPR) repeat protein
MGVAHALEHRYIQAIEHFTYAVDEASELDGETATETVRYVHERAKALQMERYYDECVEDFSFVIAHNPNNAHAYFRRGFAYKALGKLTDAAADFESAKSLDPTNPRLVVKYKELKDTVCVELCAPGEEPAF